MSLSTDAGRPHNGDSTSALVREEQILGLPKDTMAEHGTGGEVAYDLISNELLLDGADALAAPLPGRAPEDHQSFAH